MYDILEGSDLRGSFGTLGNFSRTLNDLGRSMRGNKQQGPQSEIFDFGGMWNRREIRQELSLQDWLRIVQTVQSELQVVTDAVEDL